MFVNAIENKGRNNKNIIKGVFLGFTVSCINNFCIILSLIYLLNDFIYYILTIIVAIILVLFFKVDKMRNIFITLFIGIISFILTEIIFMLFKLVDTIVKQVNGVSFEMGNGDGLGILFIYIFVFLGSLIGLITACVNTKIKQKKRV